MSVKDALAAVREAMELRLVELSAEKLILDEQADELRGKILANAKAVADVRKAAAIMKIGDLKLPNALGPRRGGGRPDPGSKSSTLLGILERSGPLPTERLVELAMETGKFADAARVRSLLGAMRFHGKRLTQGEDGGWMAIQK